MQNRWIQKIGLVAALLALTACASYIDSRVTSFQRWPANASGGTFNFAAVPADKVGLEALNYQDQVAKALQAQGLQRVGGDVRARFTVSLDYSNKTQAVQQMQMVAPPFYPYGGYVGMGWRRRGYGFSMGFPLFPAEQYIPVIRNITTYNLKVGINEASQTVFESSANIYGEGTSMLAVMPYLVKSVFAGFPGTDGQAKQLQFDSETGELAAMTAIPTQAVPTAAQPVNPALPSGTPVKP